ncbi:hypothetical protein [Streptodolium elevatio]|uniref:STAS domain-containing protein n=1 Tax=Streptodolium elevatio TaxID=3157996 RepID=A0ABV3DSW0_9ACTN
MAAVTGADTVRKLAEALDAKGVHLVFARVRTRVRELADATGLSDAIGPNGYHLRVETAVREADSRAGPPRPPGDPQATPRRAAGRGPAGAIARTSEFTGNRTRLPGERPLLTDDQ